MLAGAGVDRQHEHEPSWTAGPVGRRGRCDRELHANADRRVCAYQLAEVQVTREHIPHRPATNRSSSNAARSYPDAANSAVTPPAAYIMAITMNWQMAVYTGSLPVNSIPAAKPGLHTIPSERSELR